MLLIAVSFSTDTLRDIERAAESNWRANVELMGEHTDLATFQKLINQRGLSTKIPYIIIDGQMSVRESHLIPNRVLNHPDKLRDQIELLADRHRPILFNAMWSEDQLILFYGRSQLLERLDRIPILQLLSLLFFIAVSLSALMSRRQGENDRVWVGLAKETAHQLGTPISSLLGWVEYLKEHFVDSDITSEMQRDLQRLRIVSERFSKIGSDTNLSKSDIDEVVLSVVSYFKRRIPRGVELTYDGMSSGTTYASLNRTLFEWVVENLIKNSLDALQGSGRIDVITRSYDGKVTIEVKDTGCGLVRKDWHKIFEPGYSTKQRGWGLGLSLAKRVIEDYHNGRIAVVSSEVGVGSVMRITLKRLYDE